MVTMGNEKSADLAFKGTENRILQGTFQHPLFERGEHLYLFSRITHKEHLKASYDKINIFSYYYVISLPIICH